MLREFRGFVSTLPSIAWGGRVPKIHSQICQFYQKKIKFLFLSQHKFLLKKEIKLLTALGGPVW